MGNISLWGLQQSKYNNLKPVINHGFQSVEYGRIETVYPGRYLVDVYLLTSKKVAKNVPFCFPYSNLEIGVIYMPEKGATCVVGDLGDNQAIILGFVSIPEFNDNKELSSKHESFGLFKLDDLLEGEVLIQSSGRSFIKFNKIGNVLLSTPGYISVELNDDDGTVSILTENFEVRSESSVETRGLAKSTDGDLFQDEITEIVKDANGEDALVKKQVYVTTEVHEIYEYADNLVDYTPDSGDKKVKIKITRGNVVTFDGSDSDNPVWSREKRDGIDICYRIEIFTDTGMPKKIEIDKNGKVYMDCDVEVTGVLTLKGGVNIVE